ncbi:hypothetical protein SFUMM280S_07586 [Streptomyces fumanus]
MHARAVVATTTALLGAAALSKMVSSLSRTEGNATVPAANSVSLSGSMPRAFS